MTIVVLSALLACGSGETCGENDTAVCVDGDRTRVGFTDATIDAGVPHRFALTWSAGAVECQLAADGTTSCDPGAFVYQREVGASIRLIDIQLDEAVEEPIEVVVEADGTEVHRETVEMGLTPNSGTECHSCLQALGALNWP